MYCSVYLLLSACLCAYTQYTQYTILLGAQFFPVETQAYVLQQKASIKILSPPPHTHTHTVNLQVSTDQSMNHISLVKTSLFVLFCKIPHTLCRTRLRQYQASSAVLRQAISCTADAVSWLAPASIDVIKWTRPPPRFCVKFIVAFPDFLWPPHPVVRSDNKNFLGNV